LAHQLRTGQFLQAAKVGWVSPCPYPNKTGCLGATNKPNQERIQPRPIQMLRKSKNKVQIWNMAMSEISENEQVK